MVYKTPIAAVNKTHKRDTMNNRVKPFVLIILDGWGDSKIREHNPTQLVKTPHITRLLQNFPHTLLEASGNAVGLPAGQMGNSEVGHLHLGAGRKVPQDLTRINEDVANHQFGRNPIFQEAIRIAKEKKSRIHVLGLLSQGGVHSHENHIEALINLLDEHQVPNFLHAILDGRDTPPKSALPSLKKFHNIVSIIGRYYAMDRDQRWERTEIAYKMLADGIAPYQAINAEVALSQAYERGENDEFVKPTLIHSPHEKPIFVEDNDIIIFMNFRADRARQLTRAFTEKHFEGFKREKTPHLTEFITLTMYAKNIKAKVAYAPTPMNNTLGEFLSTQGLSQLRIAETEKYAHVTYFFNGGIEAAFPHEDQKLIPSPKVATYDLQPEMSAYLLTDEICKAVDEKKYDFIVCNFANPDMVGHTGNEAAANIAVTVIDECIGKIVDHITKAGGESIITADHGNIEKMYDEETGQAHTAHTSNKVPFLYIGRLAKFIIDHGALDDVAPTILYLLGMDPPQEMTGKVLLKLL
jgi:2,3-bisphosphoglycerate-independent phosphoglycerate mutase